jgi:hypothetical protein
MSQHSGFRALILIASLAAPTAFAGEQTPQDAAAAPASSPPAAGDEAAAPELVPVPQVPGSSFVAMSGELRAEVLRDLTAYSEEKHGCANPQVADTRTRSSKGRIRLGRDGKLVSGTITEIWRVDVCGTKRSFSVVLSPPGEGTSGVAISERE